MYGAGNHEESISVILPKYFEHLEAYTAAHYKDLYTVD